MMSDESCKVLIINYLQKHKTLIIYFELLTMFDNQYFYEKSLDNRLIMRALYI
jgi:hypothetical protein